MNFLKVGQVDYVLGHWNNNEQLGLPVLIEHCVKACQSFALAGLSLTMSEFNKK
jgi:PTH1 family peptidyl-tRNA hydrolase